MKVFNTWSDLPPTALGASLAIGNFDGVHAGHQSVIAAARMVAQRQGAPLGVATFEPLPRRFFHPDAPPFRLQTRHGRQRALAQLGVDLMFELPFDARLAAMSDKDFCADMIAAGLRARHVSTGFDFRFGHDRMGDSKSLVRHGAMLGFGVSVCEAVADERGAKASSSRVRELLQAGDVAGAAEILTRPWEAEGVVRQGDQRGRTIGFPTANLRLGDLIHPAHGVYAVTADIGDGIWRAGVANFGRTPTVGERAPLLEVNLFDFDADIYGRTLRVRLCAFLRAERKFDGLDALKAQIALDAAAARALLAAA
jgi:riboflavin kinase/FMN adenylyltransferase